MSAPGIVTRSAPEAAIGALVAAGTPPLLARIFAARGIVLPQQLDTNLEHLISPATLLNLGRMATLLADAIAAEKKLLIIADYDADGATACATGLRALRAFGAKVDYLVPNRFEYGYGLTPEIVQLAYRTRNPDILITVDNGIASVDGVAEANRCGLKVLITDHHLPGAGVPDAWCIVNPNQRGCTFPSKHLAGVGVMFYLMLALRAELRKRGAFENPANAAPNLADLLPLVALGTVADVVRLDDNNRILVEQGLKRMRAGRMPPGLIALFETAARDPRQASAFDLGFAVAPRLNAAGRLSDMSLGIECLASDDPGRVAAIAGELDRLNRERRTIESGMQEAAFARLDSMDFGDSYTLSLYDPGWHPGVVGIVASRIKDRHHRPAVAFAPGPNGEIRGSGRSIRNLHLRDALDLVEKRNPGLLLKFGGHAAAAGVTVRESDFMPFRLAFEAVARSMLTPADLDQTIETDGSLAVADATLEHATLLAGQTWGHGFPGPRFHDEFEVAGRRVIAGRHLKLQLARGRCKFDAMLFGATPDLPPRITAVYRLDVNDYNGRRSVQLTVEHWSAG